MKITKLIKTFEKVLPVLKYRLDNYSTTIKRTNFICQIGLEVSNFEVELSNVFNKKGYYREYLIEKDGITNIIADAISKGGLKFRINFIKTQLKELKNLQKQGYTDV